MSFLRGASLLRGALVLDAAVSGVTGLAMLLGAGLLESLLGVPAGLLRLAGLSLVPFVAAVAYVASRPATSAAAVRAVIAANAAWVVGSLLLLLSGRIEPNALGVAFILFQAGAVALFADLQYLGLRRASAGA